MRENDKIIQSTITFRALKCIFLRNQGFKTEDLHKKKIQIKHQQHSKSLEHFRKVPLTKSISISQIMTKFY